MKILIITSILFSLKSFSAFSIKPGLWTVETRAVIDGKEIDPQSQIITMLAKLPPDQRKKVQALLTKKGKKGESFGMSDHGMKVCIDDKVKEKEDFLNPYSQYDCETTFPTKTPTNVVAQIKCKNGTNGTAEWSVKDSTHYQGAIKMIDQTGKKSEIKYTSTFVSEKCGKIKPIDFSKLKKQSKK